MRPQVDSSKYVSSHLLLECVSICVSSDHLWSDLTSPLYMQINQYVFSVLASSAMTDRATVSVFVGVCACLCERRGEKERKRGKGAAEWTTELALKWNKTIWNCEEFWPHYETVTDDVIWVDDPVIWSRPPLNVVWVMESQKLIPSLDSNYTKPLNDQQCDSVILDIKWE